MLKIANLNEIFFVAIAKNINIEQIMLDFNISIPKSM